MGTLRCSFGAVSARTLSCLRPRTYRTDAMAAAVQFHVVAFVGVPLRAMRGATTGATNVSGRPPLPCTRPARAPSLRSAMRILWRKGVAVLALRPAAHPRHVTLPPAVLRGRDNLQVRGVYARSLPAEMVHFHPIGNRTDQKLVRDPVRRSQLTRRSRARVEASVPVAHGGRRPQPAFVGRPALNFRPEPFCVSHAT